MNLLCDYSNGKDKSSTTSTYSDLMLIRTLAG